MNARSIFFIILSLTLFYPASVVRAEMFARNLTIGSKGEDVKKLQVLLNGDARTQIASSGIGSPGNETEHFGSFTKIAVMKFQGLYRNEILVKSGITNPTGYVGVATRSTLEQILKNKTVIESKKTPSVSSAPKNESAVKSKTPITPLLPQFYSKKVTLYRAVTYQVAPKGKIVLLGSGFDSIENSINVGALYTISSVASADGATLEATLPDAVPFGTYELWVENRNGVSKDSARAITMIVTDTPAQQPYIESISPRGISVITGAVTITGSGFTPTGNNIYASLGNILNVPSGDGKTLRIAMKDFPFNSKASTPNTKGLSAMIWITIQNENGIQEKPFAVTIGL